MKNFDKKLKEINQLVNELMDEITEVEAVTEAEIRTKAASEEKLNNISMLLRNMHFNMFFMNRMKQKQEEKVVG